MDSRVISLIEMKDDDMRDFMLARYHLNLILNRHLDTVWTFKDKKLPDLQWEGVHFRIPKDFIVE